MKEVYGMADTLKPYEEMFNQHSFQFKEGEKELLSCSCGFIFDESDSLVPVSGFVYGDSFMKTKWTKYEHLLRPDYSVDSDLCPGQLHTEVDYAENHADPNWDYYAYTDERSYIKNSQVL